MDRTKYFQEYNQKNKERISLQKKQYYLQNKDKIDRSEYNTEYKKQNYERISIQKKSYYLNKVGEYTYKGKPKKKKEPKPRKKKYIPTFTIRYGEFNPFKVGFCPHTA